MRSFAAIAAVCYGVAAIACAAWGLARRDATAYKISAFQAACSLACWLMYRRWPR